MNDSDTEIPRDIGASRAAPRGTGRATDFHVWAESASYAIFQKKPEIQIFTQNLTLPKY